MLEKFMSNNPADVHQAMAYMSAPDRQPMRDAICRTVMANMADRALSAYAQ
jgi:hypothetical protein